MQTQDVTIMPDKTKEDEEQVIVTPKIFGTRRYYMFKDLQGNRIVKKAHLKQLSDSIAEVNLLAHEPMLVNERYEIIDGQHRLRIAIDKNVPIYYTIKIGAGIKEVTLLNATTAIWSTEDYLISYVEQGLDEYIKIARFAKDYNFISLTMAIMMLTQDFTTPRALRMAYKAGTFVVKDEQEAKILAAQVRDLMPYIKENAYKARDFVGSLYDVLKQISFAELLTKVEKYNLYIYRQPNRRGYMRQFEDIMNHRQRENIYRFV